jgi:hypothetical protein
VLLAQRPDAVEQRRRLALAATEPTAEALRAVRSDRITCALQSPDSLFQFVTRPEPFYLERRAAALQGNGIIPMDWVPRLWRAVGELRREEAVQHWGLKPHPLSSIPANWAAPAPDAGGVQTVLGHSWTPPAQPVDYPLTPAERERAPWPWQVEIALRDLYGGLVPSTFAPLDRPKAEAYLAAVLTMPCNTDDEAQLFVEATQYSSHFKTLAVMGALRNIGLNADYPRAAVLATTSFADATRLWNDTLSWAIGSAGVLDLLRDSPHPSARDNAAYSIRSLRESFRGSGAVRMPLPAAVLLEASRRALDPATGDAWHRLYVYAFSVVEALDDPPFRAERRLDPASPLVTQRLAEFQAWFAAERTSLQALAASQAGEIEDAERALRSVMCRSW